jgi:hypothetical protein
MEGSCSFFLIRLVALITLLVKVDHLKDMNFQAIILRRFYSLSDVFGDAILSRSKSVVGIQVWLVS